MGFAVKARGDNIPAKERWTDFITSSLVRQLGLTASSGPHQRAASWLAIQMGLGVGVVMLDGYKVSPPTCGCRGCDIPVPVVIRFCTRIRIC
jgi:hypothetical protein